MTERGKALAQKGALELLKQKITADKNEVLENLDNMLQESKSLDIRERSAREIYYRLLFSLLSEDLISRVDEIKEMPLKDVFDRLIRLTRELREEKTGVLGHGNNPLIVIQSGNASISAIDADYNIPQEEKKITEVKNKDGK